MSINPYSIIGVFAGIVIFGFFGLPLWIAYLSIQRYCKHLRQNYHEYWISLGQPLFKKKLFPLKEYCQQQGAFSTLYWQILLKRHQLPVNDEFSIKLVHRFRVGVSVSLVSFAILIAIIYSLILFIISLMMVGAALNIGYT